MILFFFSNYYELLSTINRGKSYDVKKFTWLNLKQLESFLL